MEKISFKTVIEICKGFIENPDDNTVKNEFIDLEGSLIIRSYLPVGEKVVILYKMLIDTNKSIDLPASVFSVGVDLATLFDGLLSYTNIDVNNITEEDKIYENYDILYQSGLVDYILLSCNIDYNRLVHLFERTVSYDNLLELINSIDKMDTESIAGFTKTIEKLTKELDPQVIHDLSTISKYSDPVMHNVVDGLEDEALDHIDDLRKLEKAIQ